MPEPSRPLAAGVTQLPDDADALSDVLQAIHLRGQDVCRTEASTVFRHAEPQGVRGIYVVESGRLEVTLADHTRLVSAGGLVLVARGVAHRLQADAGTVWVTGTFDVDERIAEPVLRVLPTMISIEAGERTSPWLEVALGLIVSELVEPHPGSRVMVSRLLDLLFIRALRDWAATDTARTGGLLTATLDPAIGRTLAAIDREPGRPWTVPQLAQHARLSRSTFAERFTALVGTPPGRYVTGRRLAEANRMLVVTELPVRQIADQVGYESEAAFSRAFSREFGESPRARRSQPGGQRAGERDAHLQP